MEKIQINPDAIDDNETVTHESVHLCRNIDESRHGLEKSLIKTSDSTRKIAEEDRALEESLTVAETIMRTDYGLTKDVPGYYSHLPKLSKDDNASEIALKLKEQDVNELKDNKTITYTGKNAFHRVQEKFHNLKIGLLTHQGVTASKRFDEKRRGQ